MIHWQLGDKVEGRKCYAEAAEDIAKQPHNRWAGLHREAQQLLGVAAPPSVLSENEPRSEKSKADVDSSP
jgi:hypothetical protein